MGERLLCFRARFFVFIALIVGSALLPAFVKGFLGYGSLTGYVWFDTRMFQALMIISGFIALFSDIMVDKAWDFLGGVDTRRFSVFFSIAFLLLLFLVPEIGLRANGVLQPAGERDAFFKEFYDPVEAQGLYRDHHYLGVVPSSNFTGEGMLKGIETNSHGFRDDKLRKGDDVYTVMALGGSTTWGTGVSNTSRTYPAQLERILNNRLENRTFEVINGGVGGYSSAESLINLQYRGLDHDLDAIILYNAYNDLKVNYLEGCENGDYSCWRQQTGETSDKPLWYYSRFFKFIVSNFSDTETHRHDNITEKGLNSYERNVRSIVGIARENDVDVILSTMDHIVTQENVEQSPERFEAVRGFLPRLSYKGMRTGMDVYNERLEQIAREKDVVLVDNQRLIPSTFEYHTDHVHFTDKGARTLAENFVPAVNQTIQN